MAKNVLFLKDTMIKGNGYSRGETLNAVDEKTSTKLKGLGLVKEVVEAKEPKQKPKQKPKKAD